MLPPLVIPAYQPDPKLVALVDELIRAGFPRILVIDDGSSPASAATFRELSQRSQVTLLRHAVNLGKGAALKTAFNHALLNFPEAAGVVTVDADGQHLPADVEKVARLLKEKPDSLILGARSFRKEVPLRSQFGNLLTRQVFHFLVGRHLKDTQTGLRGIPLTFLKALLPMPNNRYEFELDMLILAAGRLQIREVPITTVYEDGNKSSHFNPVFDSLRIYFVFLRFLFASFLTYLTDVSFFSLVYWMGGSLSASFLAGRIAGLAVALYGAKFFVFKSSRRTAEVAPKFLLLWLFHMGISYGLMLWLVNTLHPSVYVSRVVVDLLLFVFNFFVQREFIFKSRPEEEQS